MTREKTMNDATVTELDDRDLEPVAAGKIDLDAAHIRFRLKGGGGGGTGSAGR